MNADNQAEICTKLGHARDALLKERSAHAMTTKQLLEQLSDALRAAAAAGKSKEEMHRDLAASGVEIKFNTFRKYVSEILDHPRITRQRVTRVPALPMPNHDAPASPTPNSLRSLRSHREL